MQMVCSSRVVPIFRRNSFVSRCLIRLCIEKDADALRDKWEFAAVSKALDLGLPIFAICKGLQVFNVALGGTLKLDIRGHNLPEQKDHDIQPLRSRSARGPPF